MILNKIQNIYYCYIHSKSKCEILECEIEKIPYIRDDLILTDASEDYVGVG